MWPHGERSRPTLSASARLIADGDRALPAPDDRAHTFLVPIIRALGSYDIWVIGVCTALTVAAFADDEDNSWMVIAAVIAVSVVVIVPGGLERSSTARSGPDGVRLGLLLFGVAFLAGALRSPPETFVGLEATLVLGYLAVLVLGTRLRRNEDRL